MHTHSDTHMLSCGTNKTMWRASAFLSILKDKVNTQISPLMLLYFEETVELFKQIKFAVFGGGIFGYSGRYKKCIYIYLYIYRHIYIYIYILFLNIL